MLQAADTARADGVPAAVGRRPLRFLLTGTYNSANKGDAAMEVAALQGVDRLLPGSEVTVLSPFPDLDRPFYAPVPVARCNRRQLVRATLDLMRAALWRLLRRRQIRADWLLSPVLRLVRDSDLIIDLSGDMLTEDYGPHVAYSHFVPLLRALLLGRPYFVCAQSIGPFRITRPLARVLLDGAAAITTRDPISRDYLAAIGISNPGVRMTADLAFLLSPASAERADQLLGAEGVVLDGRPILGVSVSRLIASRYRARNPSAGRCDFLSLMHETVERVARAQDAQVLLVPHVTGPSPAKDDRRISAELRQRLHPDLVAHALSGDYRPDELKSIIARCSVFCGARMHANIAALSSAVPTVAVSYSHKTPGIMSACGVGDFVAPIESLSPDSLAELLTRAFRERASIAAGLRERVNAIQAEALGNIELLAGLAAAGRGVG
jgi:colanic acid/amylovoran biosynthesis protein